MTRKSLVSDLSIEQINMLHAKIREHNYGDHEEIASWLGTLGIKGSKSSVHRYAVRLKSIDGFDGTAGSLMLASQLNNVNSYGRLAGLYQRLGELEFEKQSVIDDIRDIMRRSHGTEPA